MSLQTKFVLHGGETVYGLDDSPDFFRELLNIKKSELSILLVYFARPENQWADLSSDDIENFRKNTDKQCNFTVASQEKLPEEIKNSDIIFFKGGDGPQLVSILQKYNDLRDMFVGKSVGGTSAGANALCKFFYSMRGGRVFEGLGVLKIKVFTHFRESYFAELNTLKSAGDGTLEVLTLAEGGHEVIVV